MSSDAASSSSSSSSSSTPTPTPTLRLGVGMARRARPQSVLARRRTSATLIGAVGRASVGFGLAVGRSRTIRPTVDLVDVNSSALRPPTNFWREPVGEPQVETPSAKRSRSADSRPTGSVEQVRRRATRSRPTWTDQVIQRSTIGYTAPPPGAISAPVTIPDDFEPFGDPKLDHLRLLMRANAAASTTSARRSEPMRRSRAESSATASSATPSRRPGAIPPDVGRSGPAESTDRTAPPLGERGDTAAGRSTGPGRLGRSMRPERVVESPAVAPAARPGPRSTVGSPLPGSDAAVRRSTGRSRATPPSKLDRLRELLIEQGVLTGDNPSAPSSATPERRPAATDPATRARQTTEPDRRGSAGTSEQLRIEQRRAAQRRAAGAVQQPGTADRPSGATGARPTAPSTRGPSIAARTPSPEPTPPRAPTSTPRPTSPPGPTSSKGAAPAAVADRERDPVRRSGRNPQPSDDWRSQEAEPDASRRAGPGVDVVDQPAADAVERRSAQLRSRQQLRAQRLLTTGLAGTTAVMRDAARVGGADLVTSNPLAQVDSIANDDEPSAAGSVDVLAVRAPVLRRRIPRLPLPTDTIRRSHDDRATEATGTTETTTAAPGTRPTGRTRAIETTVLRRRVSLPRAMSRVHRPPSPFAPARHERVDQPLAPPAPSLRAVGTQQSRQTTGAIPSGTGSAVGRVQRLAGDARGSSSQPPLASVVPADAAVVADRPAPSATGGDLVARRSSAAGLRSTIVPGPGALLDVVRRRIGPTRSTAVADLPPTERPAGAATRTRSSVPDTIRRSEASGPASAMRTRTAPTSAARTGTTTALGEAQDRMGADASSIASPTMLAAAGAPVGTAPVRPAEQLAARFMTELSRTVRRRPAPLPSTYRPMADTITSGRTVMLSTDVASRRALRKVRKVAATTDDTIHLDPAAVAAHRMNEVIAHELTHVAHPSPTPRFFDDIDDSPEERRAEQVAKIMARSPLAPSASVVAPQRSADSPASRDGSPDVIRRTAAGPSGAAPSPGTLNASMLAASIANNSRSTSTAPAPGVIRRTPATPSVPTVPDIQRLAGSSASALSATAEDDTPAPAMSDAAFVLLFRENLSQIMHLIEDRLIIELERRGGRAWGAL